MGTQRPVVIGEELMGDLGEPHAEHHGKKKLARRSHGEGGKKDIVEQIKEKKFKKETELVEEDIVSEITAEEKSEEPEKETPKKTKVGKTRVRSKKYKEVIALIDRKKMYDLATAIELVKKTTLSKFDGKVELHARFLSKNGKPENVRGTLKYPHDTGKKIKVIILDEKKIEEIKTSQKIDFDLALATPEMMPKVAVLAKILGPKGKMPNPKSGTVSNNPEKTKKELEGGMAEYKTDSYGIVHQIIGKVSAEPKILAENFKAFLTVVPSEKIVTLHLCATMGPSVKVNVK